MAGGFNSGKMITEDFQEDEVWAMMKARENSKTRKASSSSSAWRFATTPRAIPRSAGGGGGNQDFPNPSRLPQRQSSAPVNIPDWSKIFKKKPKRNLWDDACDAYNDDDTDGGRKLHHFKTDNDDDGDDDDDDDDDMVPPHKYLARRLASTQIASFSMCEGVGRTLKGRDLSNLRNAILTKTGFLE